MHPDIRDSQLAKISPLPRTGHGLTIVKIGLLTLAVELVIMLGIFWLDLTISDWKLALVDASLLAAIVAIISYFAFVRPKDRQIREVMAALDEAKRSAEDLARFDALTGVLSRRALIEALDAEVARAKRYGSALTCLMLDLDHFKTINDSYGHQCGDKVLRRIARVFSEQCRTNDHVGRYGGEEFLIILPETPIDAGTVFAERVRLKVAETALDKIEGHITVSIGVAEWLDGDGSASKLVSKADRALLEAKASGRNCIATHKPV
jgi:diguanylate cyclase (GGDEF)-like protein